MARSLGLKHAYFILDIHVMVVFVKIRDQRLVPLQT